MPKNRVAQIVQHLSPGGIETMALDMIGKSDDVIISLEGSLEDAVAAWPRLSHYADRLFFMQKKPGIDIQLPGQIAKLLQYLGINIAHTHHVGPLLYGGVASKLAGLSVLVHTEHDAWHLVNRKRRWLQTALVHLVQPTLIADTGAVADAMSDYLSIPRPQIIENGIDTNKFRPGCTNEARLHLGLPASVPLIGCAARLEDLKGHRYLLAALKMLPLGVHLALAGNGSARESLAKTVNDFGLSERVHFLGAIDDMVSFYRAIDVFCLPSLMEGMPLSPLEAQSCNRRAVVTDVGGCRASVCPKTGLMVPAKDPDALLVALNEAFKPVCIEPRDFVLRSADLHTTLDAYRMLYAA